MAFSYLYVLQNKASPLEALTWFLKILWPSFDILPVPLSDLSWIATLSILALALSIL
jgi:hypothetical protein